VFWTHPCGAPPPPPRALQGNNVTASTPGYAGSPTCIDPITNASTCDAFAYPVGDKAVYNNGMTDIDAYAPVREEWTAAGVADRRVATAAAWAPAPILHPCPALT